MADDTGSKKTKEARVIQCSCKHEHQDQVFGKNMRFHNHAPSKKAYVCTVCSSKKAV